MSARAYPASRRVESSFLTVVMAAIFALSLVPTGAWATDTPVPSIGDFEDSTTTVTNENGTTKPNQGKITLANTKLGEQYDVYRLFELASFKDNDNRTQQHPTDATDTEEAYSYVIRERTAATTTNPWWTFLTGYGPKGAYVSTSGVNAENYPYALNSVAYNGLDDNLKPLIYFVIEDQAITLTPSETGLQTSGDTINTEDATTYHVIRATDSFSNKWDAKDSESSRANDGSVANDHEDYSQTGTGGSTPETQRNLNAVQDFAQAALDFARKQGIFTSGSGVAANYTEYGVGSNIDHGTAHDAMLVVDDAGNNPVGIGTEHDGNGLVPLGYYLVGTSMGTLAALDTTNRTVSIYEKNDEPTVDKKVLRKGATTGDVSVNYLVNDKDDGTSSNWVENTDADVNDLVQFRTVVTAQQGAKDYKLHDVMEKGLELVSQTFTANGTIDAHANPATADYTDDKYVGAKTTGQPPADKIEPGTKYDVKVYLVREGATAGEGDIWLVDSAATMDLGNANSAVIKNWTFSGTPSDGCDFEIEFHDADSTSPGFTNKQDDYDVTFYARKYNATNNSYGDAAFEEIKDGDKIVVTYWAKLTSDAFVYDRDGEAQSPDHTTNNDDTQVVTGKGVNIASGKTTSQSTEEDKLDGTQIKRNRNEDDRNTNSTILTYGANSFTQWADAKVTTYQFDLTKTRAEGLDDESNDQYSLLAGAKFKLYKSTTTQQTGAGVASYTPQGTSQPTYYYNANDALWFASSADNCHNGLDIAGAHSTLSPSYADSHAFYQFVGDAKTGANTVGGATQVLESSETESIHLFGLEEGDYVLVEDKAPAGYNKLAHPIAVHVYGDLDSTNADLDYDGNASYTTTGTPPTTTLTNEGKIDVKFYANDGVSSTGYNESAADWNSTLQAVTGHGPVTTGTTRSSGLYTQPINSTPTNNGGVHIVNQTGQELPSTGGIGTTIFYVAGTVLVVGAVVMLVARRRMGSEA